MTVWPSALKARRLTNGGRALGALIGVGERKRHDHDLKGIKGITGHRNSRDRWRSPTQRESGKSPEARQGRMAPPCAAEPNSLPVRRDRKSVKSETTQDI